MPTARELLEQADALMRRNRKRGKGRIGDVPTLTDALDAGRSDTSLAPTLILPDAPALHAAAIVLDPPAATDAASSDVSVADPISLDTLGDVPVLMDAVLEWPPNPPSLPEAVEERAARDAGNAFPASAAEAQAVAAALPPPAILEQESAEYRADNVDDADTLSREVEASTTQPAAASETAFLDDDFILEIPPPGESVAPAVVELPPPIPPVAGPASLTSGSREWDALAEEIRMQVLQRLDLFTDTGLRDQLGARLAPIVERASAQLVETINREIGELVRGYVAEAIEREIDTWRDQNPEPK
jgi:hypothetical protein